MKPETILERAAADGLTLNVSHDGRIKIIGDQSVIDNWLETIKENKSAILFELRDRRVVAMLNHEPEKKYAILCDDSSTDPVLVTIGIRDKGTFDIQIPQAHYDGLALLEVIDQFTVEAHPLPQAKGRSQASPDRQRKAA